MKARHVLGLDIGTNSVGSAWIDLKTGEITPGLSVFPAGVDEADDKRGEPKNAKRRMTRRTRITLARRAKRKRELRLLLIRAGLLPEESDGMKAMLERTDPWALRRKGLDVALTPHEFGRVLMHLAQRRGALGLKPIEMHDEGEPDVANDDPAAKEDGKLRAAIGATRGEMLRLKARTFAELICLLRERDSAKKPVPITTEDRRSPSRRAKGAPREWMNPVRNKSASYEHAADRALIRHEFEELWKRQRSLKGPLAGLLTDSLKLAIDDPERKAWDLDPSKTPEDRAWYRQTFREGGLLFGQRRQTWDMGTLGRCVLEPTERCAPKADRHASYFRVVGFVNDLRVIPTGGRERGLSPEERTKMIAYLRGPLGMLPPKVIADKKVKGKVIKGKTLPERPKTTATVTDLRELMGWGKATKGTPQRFNIEADEEREINTDWFHREIVHRAFGEAGWNAMSERQRDSVNKAVLKFDPNEPIDAERLRAGAVEWWGLSPERAAALIEGWKTRRPTEDRVNLSRRAIRNLLTIMANPRDGAAGWPTEIEARKLIAEDAAFRDATTGVPLDEWARRRYATGAKGLNAADRYYQKKHPLSLPPAPMLSNPVVRKAIHEVRRHIEAHIQRTGVRPDRIVVELAREAKMGAKDADKTLFRNRLREKIRKNIIETFKLGSKEPNHQRTAVDRVLLAVQQDGVCPLCANRVVKAKITPRMAAKGEDCELSHIIPRGVGGGNGLRNMVLAHTRCNREMKRQTPREFWGERYEEMIGIVERMYEGIERLRGKAVEKAAEEKLWSGYFDMWDDKAKVANFKKTKQDLEGFRERDLTDTRYAARQVLAYLSDALFEGKGLPERGGERLIFTTDGRWTGDLRREWGLFEDSHDAKEKGVKAAEADARREKNRGDHRHHALDAVAIALTDRSVQVKFEARVKDADRQNVSAEGFEAFCKDNPVPPPSPFNGRKDLRERAIAAIFGEETERPVCHRPVKRKLIGALHEETLFGPVPGKPGLYTGTKGILSLMPNHLRVPEGWDELSAKYRRAKSQASRNLIGRELAAMDDPPPGKPGLVRDRALRDRLRACLREAGLDPDGFTTNDLKKAVEAGFLKQASGVPIRSVRMLRTMSDPVIASRVEYGHSTGEKRMVFDAATEEGDPSAARAYVGGNNHHIEIRKDAKGKWTGDVVTMYEAARRKLAFFRALRTAGVPTFKALKSGKYTKEQRRSYTPAIRAADNAHPIVDRGNAPDKGGEFVMSLCEGEMVWMLHKETKEPGYFVVAKIEKPQTVVLVPHWDARAAGERKDAFGNKVPGSKREQFAATPTDLRDLAPPGRPHAVKVRVSPLGVITELLGD